MKDNESIFLESLYGKVIINEISKKFVDEVKDAVADKELSFNNIFGNKLRIFIPLKGTKIYNEILDSIKQIQNYSGFDPQKKEVIKTIKLDPKYGGGEKEQRINLGKAISSLRIPEEEKKKYLNWFASYNSNIPEMENLKKYSVIISRSPIDVLRMSDIGKIDSCHAEGGAYFHCAIQEAKKGGPIAYLVKTEDIEGLSEEEFQNEEIFEDRSRGISGITALARLRIRKYVSKSTEEEIAVPEVRIYGEKLSGFYSTIRDFFKDKQPELENDIVISQFKNKDFLRTGGTYTDSGDDLLFNRMFDTDVLYGSLGHRGEDEDEEDGAAARANQFEEELRDFDRRFNDFEHFQASFDVQQYDDGDDVYYNVWGGASFDLPENLEPTDDFYDIDLSDPWDIKTIKNYNPKGEYEWHKRLPHGTDEVFVLKLQKFFKLFKQYEPTRDLVESISRLTVSDSGEVSLDIGFGDDYGGSSWNTDDYRYYLQDIAQYDKEYENIEKALLKSLFSAGFIKGSEEDKNIVDNKFETEEELAESLKKFEYDSSTDTFDLWHNLLMVLPDEMFSQFDNEKNSNIEKDFSKFLEKFIQQYFKPETKENKNQLTFKGFLEEYQTPILQKYGLSFSLSIGKQANYSTKHNNKESGILNSNLSIKLSYLNNVTAQLIKFLDDNAEDLINVMKLIGYRLFDIDDDNTKNFERVYGKFLI